VNVLFIFVVQLMFHNVV